MCSYGVGNVGTYNSTFTQRDVMDQAYDNPSGYYNYTELIDQAKNQTYVITDLFNNTDIPKSVFSVFLPYEAFPSTEFLSLPPPVNPTTIPSSIVCPSSSSFAVPTSTQLASTTIHLITHTPKVPVLTELVSEVLMMALTEQTSSAMVFEIPATASVVVVTAPTNELQVQSGGDSAVKSSHFLLYIIIASIAILLPLL